MIYDVEAAIKYHGLPIQDDYQLPVIVPLPIGGEWSISVEDGDGNKIPYWPDNVTLVETHIWIRVNNGIKKVYIYPVYEKKPVNDLKVVCNNILKMFMFNKECKTWDTLNNEALLRALYREMTAVNTSHERVWKKQKILEQLVISPELEGALQNVACICLLILSKNQQR